MSEVVQAGSGSLSLDCAAGQNLTLDIGNAIIVDRKVLFEPSMWLSGGQVYTASISQGCLLDIAGNAITSSPGMHAFTVLSGVQSSAPDGYNGSALGFVPRTAPPEPLSGTVDFDVSPPAFVSMYPPVGATDVPLSDFNVLLFFSEDVRLGAVGHITIFDGGGIAAWSVDLANATDRSKVAFLPQGLWLEVASTASALQAGSRYTVSLPRGTVLDLAGHLAPEVLADFTCLALEKDNRPPLVVLADPAPGSFGLAGGTRNISVWFSEEVNMSNGTIEVVPDVWLLPGAGLTAQVTSNSSSVSLSGRRLTVNASAAALAQAGTPYFLQISAGAVRDLSRMVSGHSGGGGNDFPGLAGTAHIFTTVVEDVDRPVLYEIWPPDEATAPTFTMPISLALKLLFTEPVAPVAGSVRLVPKFSLGEVAIPVLSGSVIVQGREVLIALADDLMPGEVYTMSVDAGAFADSAGNAFLRPGAITGTTFSTAPKILFSNFGGAHWSRGPSDSFHGRRFASGAVVDSGNRIILVGGGEIASGIEASVLDEVWVMETGREVHCSASLEPGRSDGCTHSRCIGDPPSLGTETLRLIVRQAPSAGGRRCVGRDGLTRSQVGEIVEERNAVCRCPLCVAPPPLPLPAHIADPASVAGYVGVSSAQGKRPLICRDGFVAEGQFTCITSSRYTGEWAAYPKCVPIACTSPPPLVGNQSTELIDAHCQNASVARPLPHGTLCNLRCLPGFSPSPPHFTCEYGRFGGFDIDKDGVPDTFLPQCERQTCGTLTIEGAVVNCTHQGAQDVSIGEKCVVECLPGWRAVNASSGPYADTPTVACHIEASSEHVKFTPLPSCLRRSCGSLKLSDMNAIKGEIVEPVLGAQQQVLCRSGWQPTSTSDRFFECAPVDQTLSGDAFWKGHFACTRAACPIRPTDPNGDIACSGGAMSVYEDICRVSCRTGYSMMEGDGTYVCMGAYFEGTGICMETRCSAPDWATIPHGSGFVDDCSDWLRHGDSCKITCESGYLAIGMFQCTYGELGRTPHCLQTGASFREQPYIKGRMKARVQALSADGNITQVDAIVLALNSSFWSVMQGAIAAASERTRSDVEVLRINGRAPLPARRLQTDVTLPPAELLVTYKVLVANDAAAAVLEADISAGEAGGFGQRLVSALVAADSRYSLEAVHLERPWKVYSWVLVEHDVLPRTFEKSSNAGLIAGVALAGVVVVGLLCAVCVGLTRKGIDASGNSGETAMVVAPIPVEGKSVAI